SALPDRNCRVPLLACPDRAACHPAPRQFRRGGNAMDDAPVKDVPPDGGMLSVTEKNRSKMREGGVETVNRQKVIALAKRLIANVKAGTGTRADSIMEVDTATYNDPVLYEKEMRAVFDTLPFVAGMSSDLSKPGDFININEFG